MSKILVFQSFHYDVAYMETFEGYLPVCFNIIDSGLNLLDERPDFIFNIEQIILLDTYWQRKPENRDRIKQYAQERRLIFCPGMWTMPDGNLPSAESCYRNALLGRQWLQEHLGVEPGPICWMADIFGHHAQSPQIYKQLGYSLYMFERGQLEEEEVVDFWWQGIDGTSLLTHWEADTYYGLHLGFAWLGNRSKEWVADRIHKTVIAPLDQGDDRDLFSKIGGDFLAPNRESLQFIENWNAEANGRGIEFTHPSGYIEKTQQRTDLKTIHQEFNPLFQGTYSSRIRIKQFNRALENLAYAVEAAAVAVDKEVNTDELWRGITMQQFHDIMCGSLCDRAWKQATADYESLCENAKGQLNGTLGAGSGDETAVFNPLPYPRTEVVESPQGSALVSLDAMEIADIEKARKVATSPVKCECSTLDNGLLRAEVDEFGRLLTLEDLTTGLAYEDQRFGYVHDVALEADFGDLWVPHSGPVNSSLLHIAPYHDPVMPSGVEIVAHGLFGRREADSQCFNPVDIATSVATNGCTATLSAKHGDDYTVHYTLHAEEKLLRIRVEHQYGSVQRRLRAIIPTGIHAGKIRREIPAGWIEQAEGEYPAQNWMDYADDHKGLCLINRGLPGNNVTDGVMLLTLFRAVAMIEANVLPDFELDVVQVAEYALHPFQTGDPTYQPTRLARRFNQPVAVVEKASLPTAGGTRIRLESDTAEILSLRPIEVGRSVELRLHDASGQASSVSIRPSCPFKNAKKTTPLGEVLGAIAQDQEGLLTVTVEPFEIVTLRLE